MSKHFTSNHKNHELKMELHVKNSSLNFLTKKEPQKAALDSL
ncbi:hypothetical protein [Vibrio vulnificus YJ016]|uniref:Uncharacterized protein n=1 Tax=Vibrio vulnificus (strain YJ016) TaxID=196600 RepID=Q7MD58_VIBVY|nr:hypothetical protein [Vibrio vulnificus YJ016]